MFTVYDWLQDPPKKFYSRSLIIAGIICIVTSLLFTALKHYNLWDTVYVLPGYSVRNYIYETGQTIAELTAWVSAKRFIKSEPAAFIVLTWFVDLAATDTFFLFTSNPYEISTAKSYTVLISLVIFIGHCAIFHRKQIKML